MSSSRPALLALICALLLVPASGAIGAESACEGCGLTHEAPIHGGLITLTDWTTNETHSYQSLACAIDAMRSRYPWSRARWADPGGRTLVLTRTDDGWEASPPQAVAISVEGSDCQSVVAFAGLEGLRSWRVGLGGVAHSEPLDLAAFAAPARTSPSDARFADVPGDHWASEAVAVSAKTGLLSGDPDGSFNGDREVSRYEMAVILQRLLARLNPRSAAGQPPAEEVTDAIRAELHSSGATDDQAEEIVHLIASRDVPTPPSVSSGAAEWPDVPRSHWAAGAVEFATGTGLMNGYPDGRFRGDEALSRYEVAVILKRLVERLQIVAEGPLPARPASSSVGEAPPAVPEPPATQPEPETPEQAALRRLQEAGFTIEQAQKALRALQGRERPASPPSQTQTEGFAQATATPGAAEPQAPPRRLFSPRTTTPGLLGQSGLLRTPAADTPAAGSVSISAATLSDGDDRVLSATFAPDDATEITASISSAPTLPASAGASSMRWWTIPARTTWRR
ncbi:MAG: S-layer homology domain-containing protein [Armatimonadota bacterium]|nr:S-layer homology domain-containing protein [Armatimonadota bacterium]